MRTIHRAEPDFPSPSPPSPPPPSTGPGVVGRPILSITPSLYTPPPHPPPNSCRRPGIACVCVCYYDPSTIQPQTITAQLSIATAIKIFKLKINHPRI